MSKNLIFIIVGVTILLIILAAIAGRYSAYSVTQQFSDVQEFWKEYEAKPEHFYVEFAQACERLLMDYGGYSDYPFDIEVEDNPNVPEIIQMESPDRIVVWSKNHISIMMVSITDEAGFHITWKQDPANASEWHLFLGGSTQEGYTVYTKDS
jgi:hypothetical protein